MSICIFVTFSLAFSKGIAYDEFERDCVREHNKFRAMHSAQALVWSHSIAAGAQKWAEYLAQNDKIEHDNETLNRKDQGENIAWFTPPLPRCGKVLKPNCITCRELVDNWYNEVLNYDFQKGSGKNSSFPVRYFAQVVRNTSMEIGVGTAISKTFGFIAVARYYPGAANTGVEAFKTNVFLKGSCFSEFSEGNLETRKVSTKANDNTTTVNSTSSGHSNQTFLRHMTCGTVTTGRHNNSEAIGDFPWTVGLRYQNRLGKSNMFCRGALLSKEWVVTAARCVNTDVGLNFKLKVVMGEFDDKNKQNDEVVIDSENVISHPLHQKETKDYDIALIKLKPPLPSFDDNIRPICLPDNDVDFSPGEACAVTGFDGNHGNALKRVDVALVSFQDCLINYDWLTERMTCSSIKEGEIDTCKGDVGSPLICLKRGKFYLAGIVSHTKNCGQTGVPGVYANVKYLMLWINDALKES